MKNIKENTVEKKEENIAQISKDVNSLRESISFFMEEDITSIAREVKEIKEILLNFLEAYKKINK